VTDRCPACDERLQRTARFCPTCGRSTDQPVEWRAVGDPGDGRFETVEVGAPRSFRNVGIAAAVLAVLFVLGSMVARDGGRESASSTTVPATTTTTTSPERSTTSVRPTTTTPAVPAAEPVQVPPMRTPLTGRLLVDAPDGRADLIDLDAGTVQRLDGDFSTFNQQGPVPRMGDQLALARNGDSRLVPLDGSAGQALDEPGFVLATSADGTRLWTVRYEGPSAPTIRALSPDGALVFGPVAVPGGSPLAMWQDTVVLVAPGAVYLWRPLEGSVSVRPTATELLAVDGRWLVSTVCGEGFVCTRSLIDLETGDVRQIPGSVSTEFGGFGTAVQPSGDLLARVTPPTRGSAGEPGGGGSSIEVVDTRTGAVTNIGQPAQFPNGLTWTLDGSTLIATVNGGLFAWQPGDEDLVRIEMERVVSQVRAVP
jgi:hypothetical protein